MRASFSRGVEQWHADSSYREIASDASLFYGEIVPPEGGDTLFADATGAYRTLDPALKRRIEGLRGVHSLETLRLWGQRQNPDRKQDVKSQVAEFPFGQPTAGARASGRRGRSRCMSVRR